MSKIDYESLDYFRRKLKEECLADRTITSFVRVVSKFKHMYGSPTADRLRDFRSYLIERYAPKTVNQYTSALNRWLKISKHSRLSIKGVRLPRASFVENVPSDAEYNRFLEYLLTIGDYRNYYVVRLLACTGARISEFVRFRLEDLERGFVDMYGKGDRYRRIYFPRQLSKEILGWAKSGGRQSGAVFLNYRGQAITSRGISAMLKLRAERAGIPTSIVYPHAFRHYFAKRFLRAHSDVVLLSDLLGHASVETTRIYLRKTSREQSVIFDRYVKW